MRLGSLHIKNFRGLQDVEFSAPTAATVIVGPNAIGKTTLLEAIRLARCLLMPSYPGEEQQALVALSIFQPHTQRLSLEAMLGNPTLPLEIKLGIELTEAELGGLEANLSVLAQVHLRNSLSLPDRSSSRCSSSSHRPLGAPSCSRRRRRSKRGCRSCVQPDGGSTQR